MSDTEGASKEEEQAMETDAAVGSEAAAEKKPAGSSAKKSPAKSPAKTKAAASPKKASPAKSPVKSTPKKAEKEEKEEEEEDEDEEEEDEEKPTKVGVLDEPLVREGKRKRESTSFLKVTEVLNSGKHKAPANDGEGTALGEIPYVAYQLESEKKVADLRPLYRVCYGTAGKITVLRKELKKFNGYSFAAGSVEYKRKHDSISKLVKAEISYMRRIFGLAAGKNKEEEVQTLLDFLLCPKDEGKKVPKKAEGKRRSSGKEKTAAGKKAKKEKKTSTKKAADGDESESEDSESEKDEEEEEEEKTPKKAAAKRKATTSEEKGKKSKPTPAKKSKKAVASSDEDEEEEGEGKKEKRADTHSATSSTTDSSEGKKEKEAEQQPTEAQLRAKIGELLKTFDLTSVSMKQMVHAVCDAFPEQRESLVERTGAIKALIKEAIKDVE